MKNEDLIKLEFERLRTYVSRGEILSHIEGDLVISDIYSTLFEKAVQADYNIAAYISQIRLAGKGTASLEQEFNQLRDQCCILFPRTAHEQELVSK